MRQKQLEMLARRNALPKPAEQEEATSTPSVPSMAPTKPTTNGQIHGLPPKPGTLPPPILNPSEATIKPSTPPPKTVVEDLTQKPKFDDPQLVGFKEVGSQLQLNHELLT